MNAAVDHPPPRVFIADDHPMIIQSLTSTFLAFDPSASVVGFTDFHKLVAALERGTPPDLVLIDFDMPGLASVRSVADFVTRHPECPIAVISGHIDSKLATSLINLGCVGFVPKRMPPNAIYHAILMMIAGGRFLPDSLIEPSSRPAAPHPATPEEAAPIVQSCRQKCGLTPREVEVLGSLAKGHTNKQIARELNIADVTVRLHLRHAYAKLHVDNRIAAVRAVFGGVLGPDFDAEQRLATKTPDPL